MRHGGNKVEPRGLMRLNRVSKLCCDFILLAEVTNPGVIYAAQTIS